jgi:hypothetical protein
MIYDQQQRLKGKKNDEQQPPSIHRHYSQKPNSKISSLTPTIDPFVLSMIERERLSIAYSSLIHPQQHNKSSKIKFDQISSNNHQDRKRIKRTTTT